MGRRIHELIPNQKRTQSLAALNTIHIRFAELYSMVGTRENRRHMCMHIAHGYNSIYNCNNYNKSNQCFIFKFDSRCIVVSYIGWYSSKTMTTTTINPLLAETTTTAQRCKTKLKQRRAMIKLTNAEHSGIATKQAREQTNADV